MKKFFRRMSMMPRGLRYKLMIAFSLMSIIPLLVCGYLVNTFVFPKLDNLSQVSLIVLLTVVIALLGLVLAKKLVDPVIDMALEAKIIASGDFEHRLKVDREDEIGDLGRSINVLMEKIKTHMVELRKYSVMTKEVNLDIQRKVLALSNLLQIGDMIATSEKLDNILEAVVEKASEIDAGSFTALFLAKEGATKMTPLASYNTGDRAVKNLAFTIGKDYLGSSIKEKKTVKIDFSTRTTPQIDETRQAFSVENCLAVPIISRREGTGFLFTGNDKKDFQFKDDDVELFKVLAKQIGIAVENDYLSKKTKELATRDELTDLYNDKYIKERLSEEIKRAILYQRPCSLLLFNIDNFKEFRDRQGEMATEDALKKVANVLKQSSPEISKAARLGPDEFAIVLAEKNKKEATELAEEIRRKIETIGAKLVKKNETPLTVSGSVSENPIDGATVKDLFDKAEAGMRKAKTEGKNRIAS